MIKVVKGDLFKNLPVNGENDLTYIFHITNNSFLWGAGFVIPLEANFPGCKDSYRKHLKDLIKRDKEPLGTCDFVGFIDGITVCNATAQDNHKPRGRLLNYAAMSECMVILKNIINEDIKNGFKPKIICPKFGAGISGGDWKTIEEFISWHWGDFDVTIYEL